MRVKQRDEKFMLREYLNKLFQEVYKEHKEYVKKHYHVVEGDKECPKLLKYEFFRFVKEINPLLLERETSIKSHVWVPTTGSGSQKLNYKSFNAYADYYSKDKNIIRAEPEDLSKKNSLWGRRKGKDREIVLEK